MTRLYRYVHVSDDGRAPCIDKKMLTLATCKPVIRRTADVGDWILGFYPSPAQPGVLCWAARISEVLSHAEYERLYRGRADAVYRADSTGRMFRLRRDYHPTDKEMSRDLSADVLLFAHDATWYFGDAPELLPTEFIHLAARGQGHRVNGSLEGDAERLEAWLRETHPPGFHGRPRHKARACAPCGAPAPPSKSGC